MAENLEILLIKDGAPRGKIRSRSIPLSGSTDGRQNTIDVIGIGQNAFIWIGERGGHCYGILDHAGIKSLIENYNDARTTKEE